jgi:hypothetical protein
MTESKRIKTISDRIDQAVLGSDVSWAGDSAWTIFGWRCWYYVKYKLSSGIRQFEYPTRDANTEFVFFLELADCLEEV